MGGEEGGNGRRGEGGEGKRERGEGREKGRCAVGILVILGSVEFVKNLVTQKKFELFAVLGNIH